MTVKIRDHVYIYILKQYKFYYFNQSTFMFLLYFINRMNDDEEVERERKSGLLFLKFVKKIYYLNNKNLCHLCFYC
jgi:hypothetical protein